MPKKSNRLSSGRAFWTNPTKSVTAEQNLALILGSTIRLPLKYWQSNFFFTGAHDAELLFSTRGEFPKTTQRNKTHPVFTLAPLPDHIGCRVCPCSSKRPFLKTYRWIKKGCQLTYTGHRMDKDSHLIDTIWFSIPASMAGTVLFRGKVPETCIVMTERDVA